MSARPTPVRRIPFPQIPFSRSRSFRTLLFRPLFFRILLFRFFGFRELCRSRHALPLVSVASRERTDSTRLPVPVICQDATRPRARSRPRDRRAS